MKHVDVAIIGSGPAGAMAAIQIAEKGYSTVLIERKKTIGVPVQCGEAITHYSLDHVNIPIKNTWIKQKVKGVKILLPQKKFFYSTVAGFSIDRAKFDQWVTDQALKKGAKLCLRTIMKSIVKQNKKWIITTNNEPIQARMLIGADGADAKTAKLLGLLQQKTYIKAFQYTFNKNDINFPISDWLCMSMDERYKGGYGWIFPRGDEFNVGIGSTQATKHMLHMLCEQFNFNIKKRIKTTGGLVPYHFSLTGRVSDQAILVGDAAGLTNPVTGGGIHAALYSGKLAGSLISQALNEENNSILHQYDSIINRSLFVHPIHRKTAEYFKHWNNKDWEFLGNAAHGLDMADLSLTKCLRIGLKYPLYLLRAKELLTIRKDMIINQRYGW